MNNLAKDPSFSPLYLPCGADQWLMTRRSADPPIAHESTLTRNMKCVIGQELGISAARLRELVAKHGVMAADVRRALNK